MMKRMLCVLAIGLLASSAMAIPSLSVLGSYGSETGSQGRAITPDGKYIAGTSGAVGVAWDAANPGTAINVLGGGAQATMASGIGYRTVNGNTQLLIHGMSAGYSTTWASDDALATFAWRARDTSVGGSPAVGAANTLGSSLGADTAYVSWSNGSNGNPLYVDSIDTAGGVVHSQKGTTTRSALQGVSATGRAIGRRRDANNNYQNYILDWNGTGTPAAYFVQGLAGNNLGEAWAVSNDGTKVFGMSPVSDGRAGNWPYMRDMVNGTIVELPTAADTGGSTLNGIVYGASADGRYAVGMNYRGSEKAFLWDTQTGHMVDLTKFAAANGILGDFTGNLRRAYSVGVDDAGNVIVTGTGVTSDLVTRGFVMVVPEPATLAFLAIGGLALVRRRR